MSARLPALASLLCLTGLLAGCGGGSAAGGDDPASAVPRDAAIYFEATVQPEGALREDALAAAGKVLRTPDPEARIEQLVDQLLAESDAPKLDYARDVEPWLGERVGFWLAAEGERVRGAAILSATDTEAAQAAIDRAIEGSAERFAERSYEGVDYKVNADGDAAGVVEDFAVLASEAELKRSIDALEGESLASDDRYTDALAELEDERLAHFYFDTKALIDQALRQDPEAAQQLQQLRGVLPIDRLGPVAGSFVANGDRLALDSVTSAAGGELFSRFGALTGTGSTPLLGELPGDAWAALGSPKLGATAKQLYQQLAGAFGGTAIAQQLRSELGIDLEQDVFSWVGDVAFFARGTSPDELDGGAVIEVLDEQRARSAFGKLIGALTGTGSTPLLGELPGDSWAALGSPKLGDTAKQLYEEFAGAFGGAAIAEQLRTELGIDLEQDIFSWVGDVAFFARGTAPEAVDGGAVIEVLDEERARSAFGKLIGVLQTRAGVSARPVAVEGAETAFELRRAGVAKPVVAARSADRVVIAYGAEAAAAALSPGEEKLAGGETFGAGRELLGDGYEPGFLLSMPSVVQLAAAVSGGDAEFEKARPYLEAFTVLVSGGKLSDDRARTRFAAGLK